MSIITINPENTEIIKFNNQDVETLILNGVEIWTSNLEFIPESQGSAGLVFTGLDASGLMETEEGFDGTIVGYMLGDGSENLCNGLDLNVLDLNASSITVPSEHNGLPVTRVGKYSLVGIGSATSSPCIVGNKYIENFVIMPNLTEIKFGYNINEFGGLYPGSTNVVSYTTIFVDYALNCRVNIPSSVKIFERPSLYGTNSFTVECSTIYDNRKDLSGDYSFDDKSGNIGCNKLIISKNSEMVGVFYKKSGSLNGDLAFAGFVEVEFEARTKPISLSEYSFAQQANLTTINLPNQLSVIPLNCFYQCSALTQITISKSVTTLGDACFSNCTSLSQITVPANVTTIGASCWYNTTALTSIRFEHSNSDPITLPTAGNSTGMLYAKTAKTMTIYTDNEIIKNYDYATDNITATILHLDGSAW